MTDNIKSLVERIRRTQADCADSLAAADLIEQLDDRIAEVMTHCRVTEAALESKNEALKGAAVIAEAAGAEIRALKARVAAAEKDAERYRWLREQNAQLGRDSYYVGLDSTENGDQWIGCDLDAAIDAAIGSAKKDTP